MFRQTMTTVAALALASGIAFAQQPDVPAPQKPAEAPAPAPATPRTPAQLVNIRLELTVTEQREGGSTVPPRTVTMLVADREYGRVRAGSGNMLLNVDARPEMIKDGRIRVMLSLEYRRVDDADKGPMSNLTESLTAILDDGKPVVVSQSADPTAARIGVRVEVKATVSK